MFSCVGHLGAVLRRMGELPIVQVVIIQSRLDAMDMKSSRKLVGSCAAHDQGSDYERYEYLFRDLQDMTAGNIVASGRRSAGRQAVVKARF